MKIPWQFPVADTRALLDRFVGSGAQRGAEHHVEIAFFGEVSRTTVRTFHLTGANPGIGVELVDFFRKIPSSLSARIRPLHSRQSRADREGRFMARVLPNKSIENNR